MSRLPPGRAGSGARAARGSRRSARGLVGGRARGRSSAEKAALGEGGWRGYRREGPGPGRGRLGGRAEGRGGWGAAERAGGLRRKTRPLARGDGASTPGKGRVGDGGGIRWGETIHRVALS